MGVACGAGKPGGNVLVMCTCPAHELARSIEQTCDGAPFSIRPIGVDDAGREGRFIGSLGDASRYSRFMYTFREPSVALIEQMVSVDSEHSMAFVAVAVEGGTESIIGVARYADSVDGSHCEFAIVVADLWQSKGVGMKVALRLIAHARSRGIRILRARISATNSRMVKFAHRLGFVTRLTPGEPGLLSAELALTMTRDGGDPIVAVTPR